MGELDGSVVVVTGGAQGIGLAVATAFAVRGAAVAVADVRSEAATSAAEGILNSSAAGAVAQGFAADVSSEDAVIALADAVTDRFGPPTVWVNNAGISRPAMLHKMTVADFDAVLAVHARGTFLGTREAARRMREHDVAGCIINVTSAAGLQGTIGQVNYAAAKGAVTAITKSAARELARYRIRVNVVAPVAATPMTEKIRTNPQLADRYAANIPMGRFAEPEEVAGAFVYLASAAASYVTGQVLCVDGGLYMAS